jgi:HEAT repeat protein
MSAVAVALSLGAFRLSAADRPDSPGQDVVLDLEHADHPVFHDDPLGAEHFLDYSGDPLVHAMPNPGPHPFPVLAAQDAFAARVVQDEASEVSEETRQRVADALATALDDDDQRVREQAINSLVAMRDERAVRGLVQSLSDPVAEVRARGVQGLQRFDTPEAIAGLQTALEDESPQVRARAVRALGQRRTTEAVPAIITLLQDSEATVRARAASALGMIRDDRAIDPLTAALKDPEPAVRERAARALGDLARAQRRGLSVFPRAAPVPPVPPSPPVPPDVRFFAPEIDLDFDLPDIDIDFEEIRRIQDEALAGIDFERIQRMHDEALAESEASLAEVNASLEEFEWSDLQDLRERFELEERRSR